MSELHTAPIRRIAHKEGTGRISEDALETLVSSAEAYVSELAGQAASNAEHAGRRTINSEDIDKALTEI